MDTFEKVNNKVARDLAKRVHLFFRKQIFVSSSGEEFIPKPYSSEGKGWTFCDEI